MKIEPGSLVTLNLNSPASNTFVVDCIDDGDCFLTHPLAKGLLMRVRVAELNTVHPNIKDSTERCIDYANSNRKILDSNSVHDLEAIGLYFAFKRKLTPKLKQLLANICGTIAEIKFDSEVDRAMRFVIENQSMLDAFNMMWFTNFKGLFNGNQPITSKKQTGAIFNIAGYALAQLENPTAQTRK
jgi:hypothetical protein